MIDGSGLSPREVLHRVQQARRMERAARNQKLIMACCWADLFPAESIDRDQLAIRGGDRPIRLGGEGTPAMASFAVPELAAELGMNRRGAEALIADALDLRHRLPALWVRVCANEVEGWQAQKIARETRHLSSDQVRQVDHDIASSVGRLSWGRLARALQASIIRADAERIAELATEQAARTGVFLGRSEGGFQAADIRADAATVLWFYATVDRLADILGQLGDARSKDCRRAAGVAILSNPLQALQLLAQDCNPSLFDDLDGAPVELEQAEPGPTRECRFPRIDHDQELARRAIDAIGKLDPAKLRPPATLYVHVAVETLQSGLGATRVEGVGPVISDLVADWLHRCDVVVRPVIDLNVDATPVDSYEIPARMRERVFLKHPASVFPYSAGIGRRQDLDHSAPYRIGALGQTREDNLGPLTRTEHNVVTHGGWSRRRPEPETFLFRAPQGRVFLVNEHGTTDLGQDQFAQLIWDATTPRTNAA